MINARSLLLLSVAFFFTDGRYYKPSVYQKIRQSPKLSKFYTELENNRPAKLNLQYGEMTVFAPNNEAFEWYTGGNFPYIVHYHMAWFAKSLKELQTGYLTTLMNNNPPLWITKLEDDIYVNNARIVQEYSDYISEINNRQTKPQVLHVIDEVLNPLLKTSANDISNPTAFDLLSRPQFWDFGRHSIELFYRKVVSSRKESVFKSEGNFTFFIPINEGFTDYRFQMMDYNIIDSHIIPNKVLFTRPSPKDVPYETLAKENAFYVVLIFSEAEGKLHVKSHTLAGNANHPSGEMAAEIVVSNIPVRNGVVHLIKRPLTVFDRKLTLFPLLPILDKVSMDPSLSISYSLGESSGFNTLLVGNKKYTYFVPRDKAWKTAMTFMELNSTYFTQFVGKYTDGILRRHLLVGNQAYTIEDLRKLSNTSDTADVDMFTEGGVLKIGIGENEGKYTIYWRNKFIPIHRSNYYCTNGIVHIVDDLFINEEDLEEGDASAEGTNPLRLLNMLIKVTV